ncbi:MAG TPA: sodium:proton antiporter [Fimbriiglobus sp.]|jgi:Na+/H+ antiporter NhaD/arsenite permease-like protein
MFPIFSAAGFDVAPWAPAPFALLLLAIAILPLAAGHWWRSNRNRLIIALGFALPVVAYLLALNGDTNGASLRALLHELQSYVSFMVILTALYVINGGIVISGDVLARPRTNVAFLAAGTVLANFIGTTGASILLIRPLLKTNSERKRKNHVPVFFIFLVSNAGGLLVPLGPPLFLGFLNGVPFTWTLQLWPQWLVVVGILLLIFWIWDLRAYSRETPADLARDLSNVQPLGFRGWKLNGVLLLAVVGVVLLQKYLPFPAGDAAMAGLALISWWKTPRNLRELNRYSWGPILEVAILFLGIFVCMVPMLALLERHGGELGLASPMQFFWVSGALSAILDNAPTYLTLGTLAATVTNSDGLRGLTTTAPHLLAAVSCGAVFLGAMTYIGNGPNFMVKAIAEESGYRMPSFFGYMAYSGAVLMPVLFVASLIFFR